MEVVSSIMNSMAGLAASVIPFPSTVRYLVLPVGGTGANIVMAVATLCGTGWGEWAANNLVKVAPASVMVLVSVEGVVDFSSFLSFLVPAAPVFPFFVDFPSFRLHLIRWYRETPSSCCFFL